MGRAQQDHVAVLVGHAEREHLGHERADLARREVHDGDHEAALELVARVVRDLRRRALLADLGAEVDVQLPGRLAGLGEVLDAGDAAHADVDLEEVVEVDQGAAAEAEAAAGRCVPPGSPAGGAGGGVSPSTAARLRGLLIAPARWARRAEWPARPDPARAAARSRSSRPPAPAVRAAAAARPLPPARAPARRGTGAARKLGGRGRGRGGRGLSSARRRLRPWRGVRGRNGAAPARAPRAACAGGATWRSLTFFTSTAPAVTITAAATPGGGLGGERRDAGGHGAARGEAARCGHAPRRPRRRSRRPRRRRRRLRRAAPRSAESGLREPQLLEEHERPERVDGGERPVRLAQLGAEGAAAVAGPQVAAHRRRSCG